jgi:3-methylcrotonyl-CoA carboxylase alpha subunit
MITKLLIANRGEIACRIIRTARRLGVLTVAVYSEADANAWHVAQADEAVAIGPAAARESYLNIDRLIAAAKATGADAIHPGYGFLSENAGFAERVGAAGLIFVGPPPSAIRAMGSKSEAKALMEKAGVPVVPGYHGQDQDDHTLTSAAELIGYPVLLKASAGGGGKGMRRVDKPAELSAALASARREAKAAFGDDRMLVEKYLLKPRHVELQVFADRHGHVLHLFERDCSIQRRHQKVIEEAPAPGLPTELRHRMGDAAVAAAGAVGYVGAGTVEFILDQRGQFFFMEMNTRLQVEHPVTEMITGLDLVEWQLHVASGEALPLSQADVIEKGHAFEARVYAEDPARDFLPATGRLAHFRVPAGTDHVRVDSGVRSGDEISIHYDPMVAKLVVWDRNRELARQRLVRALGDVELVGFANNIEFLQALARDPAFAAAEVDTGFIERHRERLFAPLAPAGEPIVAAAALWVLLAEGGRGGKSSGAADSPWNARDGWRLNLESRRVFQFDEGSVEWEFTVRYGRQGYTFDFGNSRVEVTAEYLPESRLRVAFGGHCFDATVIRQDLVFHVFAGGRSYRLTMTDPLAAAEAIEAPTGRLTAPMPGRIVHLHVKKGDRVKHGDTLLVLEAMKMEHSILAPRDGVVEAMDFAVGDLVEEGVELLALAIEASK